MYTNKKDITSSQFIGLILLAYIFSFAVRLIWVWQFKDNPNFLWEGQLMINTNDGYVWAAGAKKYLTGAYEAGARIPNIWNYGVILFTVALVKITPFSLETIILYLPAVIASLVVIPIIAITRLYGKTFWGFLAALIGAIAWSYYNRTMIGYYDTDTFSIMTPMFILFFLMKTTLDMKLRTALYGAIIIAVYPFLYDSGLSIIYAMGITYALYMLVYHRNENITYLSLILIFSSLLPLPLPAPYLYLLRVVILISMYIILVRVPIKQKKLIIISLVLFAAFMFFGNVLNLILGKVSNYISIGTKENGLHFYSVAQTVREAGSIPFETFANRISGSIVGLLISLAGYIVLVLRYRAFILALPLIGIGVFALWGGLRFTVYAVPLAALSSVYIFVLLANYIKNYRAKYLFVVLSTGLMIYPNIVHIINYKVPTVLDKVEVADLVKLNRLSESEDYTLAWWDYGYPIIFYSDTSTLIDGGKHQNDNFIISKIMQTNSAQLAANLARVAVETYVDSNYSIVGNTLFKNGQKDQLDPNMLLAEMDSDSYDLPPKTRDIFLYLPYRMMNIFPTVAVFGNLNLLTGNKERNIFFRPVGATGNSNGILTFQNGMSFDTKKGELSTGQGKQKVKYFIVTENGKGGATKLQSQRYHSDGQYAVVYMKSYGRFVIMDIQTLDSMFVQMFILGKYDKNLFELVVSSPYSKIYKLKR